MIILSSFINIKNKTKKIALCNLNGNTDTPRMTTVSLQMRLRHLNGVLQTLGIVSCLPLVLVLRIISKNTILADIFVSKERFLT